MNELRIIHVAPPPRDHAALMEYLLADIAAGVGIPHASLPTPGECLGRPAPVVVGLGLPTRYSLPATRYSPP